MPVPSRGNARVLQYAPNDWRSLPNYPQVDRDNSYLITRHDDFLLDAKGYIPGPAAADPPARMDLGGVGDVRQLPLHPAGVGHLLNHPPRGSEANIMPLTYDVPEVLPERWRRAMPNRYFRPPTLLFLREGVVLRTILLITTAHVHNGELFLEYVVGRARRRPTPRSRPARSPLLRADRGDEEREGRFGR